MISKDGFGIAMIGVIFMPKVFYFRHTKDDVSRVRGNLRTTACLGFGLRG
jgi:hypothetical protein